MLYKERDEEKRNTYLQEIEELKKEENKNILIYGDECGIQKDLVRQYGRCQKGERLYGETIATRHAKTGIVAGYTKLPDNDNYVYVAPWIYNCNCDTIVFNTWLEKIFIPEVNKLQKIYADYNFTLILDNVSYHKSEKTKEKLVKANINLKFQPPYSPDLNPIEPSWDTTKNKVRNRQQKDNQDTFLTKLCKSLVSRSWV